MKNNSKYALALMSAFLLSSCSHPIQEYENTSPAFNIQSYFNGDVIAWGIIKNFSDKVERRFCVELNGKWQGDNGVLAEKFYFDDGEVSYRNWALVYQSDGTYHGTAEDVEGVAVGKNKGFAFQLEYHLQLTLKDDTYLVKMNDWMYQLDKYRVMNTTTMSKLGVDVAEITLFFDKQYEGRTCL
ncbi:MAG: DUF3833 domain-containing protein [Thalassotalea sp.]